MRWTFRGCGGQKQGWISWILMWKIQIWHRFIKYIKKTEENTNLIIFGDEKCQKKAEKLDVRGHSGVHWPPIFKIPNFMGR